MERTCRWCGTQFAPVNEFRFLCDECHGWATNDLGMKRAKRTITIGKPRHFESLHRDIERQERAYFRTIDSEIKLARKIDDIREMHAAIMSGRAGSWYQTKTLEERKRIIKNGS